MKILLFVLFLVTLQTKTFAELQKNKKIPFKRSVVEVFEAKKANLYSLTPSYGRIISLEPYAIISKINEDVKKIYVLEGAEVFEGQKLLELENKNIKRLIQRYEAEILYNQNYLQLLNEELTIINEKLKRIFNLKKNKVISNDVYDNLRIKKINLKKQISKVEFDLKRLSYVLLSSKEDFANTIIRSPIDGNLIKFDVKLGSVLAKGTNIGLILNPRNNEIEASLRSDLASKLRPGFPVKILNEGKTFDGSIRGIVASENIKTGSKLLKIRIPKSFPKEINFPNKRIELRIPVNNGKSKVVIPKDGLVTSDNEKIVYIVKNNKVIKKKVVLGQSFKDQIEIVKGINEGDLVVVRGNENVRPNQLVKIQNKIK